jgi:membrane protease subunit (stomatin/prohibitin family)
MSILDKFTKGVGEAADRAKFEADKALRVRRIKAEVENLEEQVQKATLAVGTKAVELRPEGLEDLVEQVEKLQVQFDAKKEELAQAQAEEWVEPEPTAKFCANCGTELEPGAKFCPKCGEKVA